MSYLRQIGSIVLRAANLSMIVMIFVADAILDGAAAEVERRGSGVHNRY